MTVALSSLRVTAEMDASGYARGMAVKNQADQTAIASSKALGAALAQQDTALGTSVAGAARLNRELINGYGAGSQFEAVIRRIGAAADRGLGMDRVALLLDQAYRKFGLVADGARLAQEGFVKIAPTVEQLNRHYETQSTILDRAAQAQMRYTQALAAQSAINQRIGVNDNYTPGAAMDSGSAMVQQLDELRKQYDPLFVAEEKHKQEIKDINTLYATGSVPLDRYNQLLQQSEARHHLAQVSLGGTNKAARLTAGEFTNLGFQINDVLTGLALGQPLMMIAAQQGGQVYQVLNNSGPAAKGFGAAVAAAFGTIKDFVVSLITPLNVTITLIAAIGATAVVAAMKAGSAIRDIQRQLTGIGAASGVTTQNILDIASKNAGEGKLGYVAGRDTATALAATGRIDGSNIERITAIAHDFAKTLGIDATEAAKQLADAFSEPVKGAEELNKRLMAVDAGTKQLIETLTLAGDRQRAIAILIEKTSSSLASAADITSFWARAWDSVANAASRYFNEAGRYLDRQSGGGTLEEQLSFARGQVTSAKANQAGGVKPLDALIYGTKQTQQILDQQVRDWEGRVSDLEARIGNLSQKSAMTRATEESNAIRPMIDKILPEIRDRAMAAAEATRLRGVSEDPLYLKLMNLSVADAERAAAIAKSRAENIKAEVQRAAESAELQVSFLDRRSPADRAALARQQKTQELAPTGLLATAEGQRQIAAAAKLAAGGQTALDAVERQRISTLGQLASVEEIVKSKQLELDNAGREGVKITKEQEAALLRIARTQEEGARLQDKVTAGIAHDTEIRRQLNNELQVLIDRKLLDPKNALDMADAQVVLAKRFEQMSNQAALARAPLEQLKRLEQDSGSWRLQLDTVATSTLNSLSSSLADITTGTKTAGQAFSDMGRMVIRALEEMLIKMLIIQPIAAQLQSTLSGGAGGFNFASLFGGGTAGTPTSLAPPAAPALPPTTLPLVYHSGTDYVGTGGTTRGPMPMSMFANAPRYHLGVNEVPAILERGERVIPRGGAMGSNVVVNVINQTGSTSVKTRERNEGGVVYKDVILTAVKEDMSRGGFDKVQGSRFGTPLRPRAR